MDVDNSVVWPHMLFGIPNNMCGHKQASKQASTISELPDDGDYTETCWSCFNVSFKIVFKTIQLCINW